MKEFYDIIELINSIVWGPPAVILLVSTGIFLTFRFKAKDGTIAAGPIYDLKFGLKVPFLGGIFDFMLIIENFFTSPLQPTNSIALIFKVQMGIPRYVTINGH